MCCVCITCNQNVIKLDKNMWNTLQEILMVRWKIPGAAETPKGSLLKQNRPLLVSIVVSWLDSSSRSSCWYACVKSSLVYVSPPERIAKRSSTFGSFVPTVLAQIHFVASHFVVGTLRHLPLPAISSRAFCRLSFRCGDTSSLEHEQDCGILLSTKTT